MQDLLLTLEAQRHAARLLFKHSSQDTLKDYKDTLANRIKLKLKADYQKIGSSKDKEVVKELAQALEQQEKQEGKSVY